MLGGRAIGAIIGIISGCSLIFLLLACCIVYYRRYLQRKEHTYVAAAQAVDERRNVEQTENTDRTTHYLSTDSPPPYSEAVRCLNDI